MFKSEAVWRRMPWLPEIPYFLRWFPFELTAVILLSLPSGGVSKEVDCFSLEVFSVSLFTCWVVRRLPFVIFGRGGVGCWSGSVVSSGILANGPAAFSSIRDISATFCASNSSLKEIRFLESHGRVWNLPPPLPPSISKASLNTPSWSYLRLPVQSLLSGTIPESW